MPFGIIPGQWPVVFVILYSVVVLTNEIDSGDEQIIETYVTHKRKLNF